MCIAAAMGTTYVCESFFSKLEIVKLKNRKRSTNEKMTNELPWATTKPPNEIKNCSITIKSKSHIKVANEKYPTMVSFALFFMFVSKL